jgi:hypothetical protein
LNELHVLLTVITPDISQWDVSKVNNIEGAFAHSSFSGGKFVFHDTFNELHVLLTFITPDISQWDVSKVNNMNRMFQNSSFNEE